MMVRVAFDHVFVCILGVLCYFLYRNSLSGAFIWDDRAAIIANKDVTCENQWYEVFLHDFWGQDIRLHDSHKSYRPITVLSFRLDHNIYGLRAYGYHYSNVMLYAATCVSFYFLAKQVINRQGAVIAALLFTVHPVHVENVASIVGRADCLAGLFFCLAVLNYLRSMRQHSVPAAVLAWTFALLSALSKEVGVTALALFIAMEVFDALRLSLVRDNEYRVYTVKGDAKQANSFSPSPNSSHWLHHNSDALTCSYPSSSILSMLAALLGAGSGFFPVDAVRTGKPAAVLTLSLYRWFRVLGSTLLLLIFFQFRAWLHGAHYLYPWSMLENHIHLMPLFSERSLSYAHSHAWYLFKLLYPRYLCFDYGFDCLPVVTSIYDMRNVFPLAVYGAVLYGISSALLTGRLSLLFGYTWWFLSLLPALNIVMPVGTTLAERLLFVPSAGLCLCLGEYLTVDLRSTVIWAESRLSGWLFAGEEFLEQQHIGLQVQQWMATQSSSEKERRESRRRFDRTAPVSTAREKKRTAVRRSAADAASVESDGSTSSSASSNASDSRHHHRPSSSRATQSLVVGHAEGNKKAEIDRSTWIARHVQSMVDYLDAITTRASASSEENSDTAPRRIRCGSSKSRTQGSLVLWVGLLLPVLWGGYAVVSQRCLDWQSEPALYASALSVCPRSLKALTNTAMILSGVEGASFQALDFAQRAVQVSSNNTAALLNVGVAEQRVGNFVQSMAHFERLYLVTAGQELLQTPWGHLPDSILHPRANETAATRVPPKLHGYFTSTAFHWAKRIPDPIVRQQLMSIAFTYANESFYRGFAPPAFLLYASQAADEIGNTGYAVDLAEAAIRSMDALLEQRRRSGDRTILEDIISLDVAYNIYANLLYKQQRSAEALQAVRIAQELATQAGNEHNYLAAYINEAAMRKDLGDADGARRLYEEFIAKQRLRVTDKNQEPVTNKDGFISPAVWNNLGILEMSAGNYQRAIECYQEALRVWTAVPARQKDLDADLRVVVENNIIEARQKVAEQELALQVAAAIAADTTVDTNGEAEQTVDMDGTSDAAVSTKTMEESIQAVDSAPTQTSGEAEVSDTVEEVVSEGAVIGSDELVVTEVDSQ